MKNIKWKSEEFRSDFLDHWIENYKGVDIIYLKTGGLGCIGFVQDDLLFSCVCPISKKEEYLKALKEKIDE